MSGLIKLRNDMDPREVASVVIDDVIQALSDPAYRAGIGASMLTAAVMAKLTGKFGVSMVIALMVGASVEHLYGMAEDIRASLTCPPLLFHGSGCPGHTTGLPAEACLAGSDAPGKV